MKQIEPSHIRNVGTFGHGGEGKTSLAEAMLFDTGENTRLGRVDDGSSLMDYEPEEINRKITISASASHFEWDKHKFNLLDTPGYANFIAEAKASMRVVDGAIIVIGANSGVKVNTEAVWGYANEFQVPRILYVCKMDTERADFMRVVEEVKKTFPSQPAVPVQIPIGSEANFKGVVDLIQRKAYIYQGDGSGKFELKDVPPDLKEEVDRLREKMVETVVEMDDQLMEKYLESGRSPQRRSFSAFGKGRLKGGWFPPFAVLRPGIWASNLFSIRWSSVSHLPLREVRCWGRIQRRGSPKRGNPRRTVPSPRSCSKRSRIPLQGN